MMINDTPHWYDCSVPDDEWDGHTGIPEVLADPDYWSKHHEPRRKPKPKIAEPRATEPKPRSRESEKTRPTKPAAAKITKRTKTIQTTQKR